MATLRGILADRLRSAFRSGPNGILAKTLFDRRPEWGDTLALKTASIVKRIALDNDDELPEALSHDLAVVRRFRDDGETRFVTTLAEIRRQLGLDHNAPSDFASSERPTPSDFLRSGIVRSLGAHALTMNCAAELRLRVSTDEIARRAAILEPHIPTALAVFESVIAKVVSAGAAPHNHSNSYWDFQLALFAAESMRVEGRPVIVVTEDKPVRRAALDTGASDRVLDLNGYREFLHKRLPA